MLLAQRVAVARISSLSPGARPRLLALRAASAKVAACWKCDADPGPGIFHCGACGVIQPVSPDRSLFALFRLDPAIDVNAADLEGRFRGLQKTLHPDKYAQSSPAERDYSAANSALVNVAYQTLRDPMDRLKYVLLLEGVDVLGETSAADPVLLMEVMELREAVEEADSLPTLEELQASSQASVDATLQLLSADFKARDYARLGQNAVRLQYYTKILEEVRGAMEALRD